MSQGCKPFIEDPWGESIRLPHVQKILAGFPCEKYHFCEPIVGSGALFFGVGGRFRSRVLADFNPDLIGLYKVVQADVEALIAELGSGPYVYDGPGDPESVANALRIRDSRPATPVEQAARTAFLLATGEHEMRLWAHVVGYDASRRCDMNLAICDAQALRDASRALRGAAIGSVEAVRVIRRLPDRRILLIVEPPLELGPFGEFAELDDGFTKGDQSDLVREMLASGHRYIYFNHSTEFVRNLFAESGATMLEVSERCFTGRTPIRGVGLTDLIVHNLPKGLAPPAGRSSGRVLADAGWPVGSPTSRGFVPVALTSDQHLALEARAWAAALPAGDLARRVIGRFLAAEPGGDPIRNAGAPG